VTIPVVLTIGALDPLGVDGIAADLRGFAALRAHGAAVATAVAGEALPIEVVERQLALVLTGTELAAVKTGLLGSRATVEAVAAALTGRGVPVIVDPSLAGREGGEPPDAEAVEAYRTCLLPLATVATPNLAEAALLTGMAPAGTLGQMLRQGEALVGLGCAHAVVSGGHGHAATSTDILVSHDAAPMQMNGERLDREGLGGLSTTFAAAIAANIARGDPAVPAIEYAKLFVTAAIADAGTYAPARGPRPVNAFHRMWLVPAASTDAASEPG
jgi:hydroxymethylpyrimidine/phosphomethylpyrimidine kinase